VLESASTISIDTIIIEPGNIRGTSECGQVFILHQDGVPDLPFGSIALNRISMFKLRHSLVRSLSPTYDVTEHKVDFNGTQLSFARTIHMATKKLKVDFRCANPITIRSPREVLDPITYLVTGIPTWLDTLSRGLQAMGGQLVKVHRTAGEVSLSAIDANGDAFDYNIGSDEFTEADDNFAFEYDAKMFVNIIKRVKQDSFSITANGMINAVVDNLNVYLKPVA
jgi:hypothetical protein